MSAPHYDVLIVGAGIAGSALAHALSIQPRSKPLRIALLERSLAEPDRIVGELLQPGGVGALRKLRMESCLENIDAIPVHGYCVVHLGQSVHIPYPQGYEGRSFHHGKFIMSLREKAKRAAGVDVIEATVTDLIECQFTRRVIGVRATRPGSGDGEKDVFFADLVVIADGCFSNFRNSVMGAAGKKTLTRSHFIGSILVDAKLPIPQHGTVVLVKGQGPVLLYQISEHDTRMLVDVKQPLPPDLKDHILSNVIPHLPAALHEPANDTVGKDRLRRMPNSFLPPVNQGGKNCKEGVILFGDAWNMRHPLTGGGMTVALNDVVLFSRLLSEVDDLHDWGHVSEILHRWHWERKPLASTINVLSVALYDLFGADDESLSVLQAGCFKYFERGGDCIRVPVSLLAGILPSRLSLAYHFFSVAFYSIWILLTHERPVRSRSHPSLRDEKIAMAAPRVDEYPKLLILSVKVLWTACVVFGPLIWSEFQ